VPDSLLLFTLRASPCIGRAACFLKIRSPVAPGLTADVSWDYGDLPSRRAAPRGGSLVACGASHLTDPSWYCDATVSRSATVGRRPTYRLPSQGASLPTIYTSTYLPIHLSNPPTYLLLLLLYLITILLVYYLSIYLPVCLSAFSSSIYLTTSLTTRPDM
jgi:hypothetical protein